MNGDVMEKRNMAALERTAVERTRWIGKRKQLADGRHMSKSGQGGFYEFFPPSLEARTSLLCRVRPQPMSYPVRYMIHT